MPFCPKCKFEYKPEIGVCPDCGEKLGDSLPDPEADAGHDEYAEDRWKLLYFATNRSAAEFLKETLEASGITCAVKYRGRFFGRGISFGLGAVADAADAEVWVLKEQFDQAREIRRQTVGDRDTAHGFLPED